MAKQRLLKKGYKRSPLPCGVCYRHDIQVPLACTTKRMLAKMTCSWACRNVLRMRKNDWRRQLHGGLCTCQCGCKAPLSRDYVTLCYACRTKYNNARRSRDPVLLHRDWLRDMRKSKNRHKGELPFDIWITFWQQACLFCEQVPDTIGIDRWDSKKPYSIENTVPCCYPCNMAFGNRDKMTTLAHMAAIVARQPGIVPAVHNERDAKNACFKNKR